MLAFAWAIPAHADLYRWVDPQTGSIKYSNHPPPWYGDPEKEARAPAVQVIRQERPKPQPPVAAKAPVKPAPASSSASELETQLAAILQAFRQAPGTTVRQQVELYRAMSAELDRQDPAGAARRRAAAERSGMLEQLREQK